jgi:hypothetical protein
LGLTVTVIQTEEASPFAVRIFVNNALVVLQPYNPNGGVPWTSQEEAQAWAFELAQENIDNGAWPPLS